MTPNQGKTNDSPQNPERLDSLGWVFKGAVQILFGDMFARFILLALNIFIARSLSIEDFAIYSLVYTIWIFSIWASQLGIQLSITRLIPEVIGDHARDSRLVSTVFTIVWTSSFLWVFVLMLAAILIIGNHVEHENLLVVFALFGFAIPFAVSTRMSGVMLLARRMVIRSSLVLNGIRSITLMICIVLFIFLVGGIIGVALGVFSGTILSGIIAFLLYLNSNKHLHLRPDVSCLKQILKFSLPIFISGIIFQLFLTFPIFLVSKNFTPKDIAIFGVVTNISLQVFMFVSALKNVAMPIISTLNIEGKTSETKQLFKELSKIYVLFLAPAFSVVMFWPEPLLSLFGSEYVAGGNVMRIMVGSWIIYFLKGPILEYFIATARSKYEPYIQLTGLIVAVVAILSLLTFGVAGVAIGVATGIVTMMVMELSLFYGIEGYFPFNRPTLKGLAPIAILILPLIIPSGIVVELLSIVIFPILYWQWSFTAHERNNLINAWRTRSY